MVVTGPAAAARVPLRLHAWARGGPALALRASTALAAGFDASAGIGLGESVWLGVGGTWLSARDVQSGVHAGLMSSLDGSVGAWWSPGALRVAPVLGASLGLSLRSYAQDGVPLERFDVVLISTEAGAALALSPTLALVPGLRLTTDLDRTLLVLPDGTEETLSPLQFSGTVDLRGRWP